MKYKEFPSVAGIRLGHMRFVENLIAMSTRKYCAQKQLGGIQITADEHVILISYPKTDNPKTVMKIIHLNGQHNPTQIQLGYVLH